MASSPKCWSMMAPIDLIRKLDPNIAASQIGSPASLDHTCQLTNSDASVTTLMLQLNAQAVSQRKPDLQDMQDGGEILWSLDADVQGSDSDEHALGQEVASAGHNQAAAGLPSQEADKLIQSLVRRGHISLICRRLD